MLRIHAICMALNEEPFIANQLKNLYPFCSGISVLTQYDRDFYGVRVEPDRTVDIVKNFPDPEGKIQLVLRRWRDYAAALNSEMLALSQRPHRGVMGHGVDWKEVCRLHDPPDYFLIVDADEFYDPATFPAILELLRQKRPKGMRVWGINYVRSWNRSFSREAVPFLHFGFLRPGLTLESMRIHRWNESRLQKLCSICRLPDISAAFFGFITCPFEVGYFHHGCWLGDENRLTKKDSKSAHRDEINQDKNKNTSVAKMQEIEKKGLVSVSSVVPDFLRKMAWPEGWIESDRGNSMPEN